MTDYDNAVGTATLMVRVQSNVAPIVMTCPDFAVTLPDVAQLSAQVIDDNLPSTDLTLTWSVVSGVGAVAFGNVNAASSTAAFSQAGFYVLRLTAFDGVLQSFDDLVVTVLPQA